MKWQNCFLKINNFAQNFTYFELKKIVRGDELIDCLSKVKANLKVQKRSKLLFVETLICTKNNDL